MGATWALLSTYPCQIELQLCTAKTLRVLLTLTVPQIIVVFTQQALAYYDRAIQFNENDESAFVNRAITKAVIKDSNGALSDFSKAILISPKSAHIYFNRGNLYFTQGK